jgi:phosphatidate cytidylyltransferase
MLRQRIITTTILLPILLAAIWFGELWLVLLLTVVAAAGSYEFYRLDLNGKLIPLHYFGIITIIALLMIPYFSPGITVTHILSLAVIISLVWLLFTNHKEQAFNRWSWTMAGLLYLGLMPSYWVKLRCIEYGRDYVFWLISIIIINDVAAYFVGRALGKHALAPKISPRKTWEGAAGALIASILVSVAFYFSGILPLHCWQLVWIGLLLSVVSQMGDLIESLLKRNKSVKDSGNLLPGHGGILDRVDSYIITATAAYYIITAIS